MENGIADHSEDNGHAKENIAPLVPRGFIFDEENEEEGGDKKGDGLFELDSGHHKMGILPLKQ